MSARIKHRNYVVEYVTDEAADTVDTFDVRVITVDILAAEQAAPSYAITPNSAIALNLMWVWQAMMRAGLIGKCGWPEFARRCVEWRDAGHADVTSDEPSEVEVPPTMPGVSTPSSSPLPHEASGDSTSMGGEPSHATTSSS